MVQVQLTARLQVTGGPTLALGVTVEPDSYTFASVELAATGVAEAEQELPLLPDGGEVLLLAVTVHHADGKPAEVTLTPVNAGTSGHPLQVDGTLVVAHAGVLAALVAGGPRALTLTNAGSTPVVVDVLAALDAP